MSGDGFNSYPYHLDPQYADGRYRMGSLSWEEHRGHSAPSNFYRDPAYSNARGVPYPGTRGFERYDYYPGPTPIQEIPRPFPGIVQDPTKYMRPYDGGGGPNIQSPAAPDDDDEFKLNLSISDDDHDFHTANIWEGNRLRYSIDSDEQFPLMQDGLVQPHAVSYHREVSPDDDIKPGLMSVFRSDLDTNKILSRKDSEPKPLDVAYLPDLSKYDDSFENNQESKAAFKVPQRPPPKVTNPCQLRPRHCTEQTLSSAHLLTILSRGKASPLDNDENGKDIQISTLEDQTQSSLTNLKEESPKPLQSSEILKALTSVAKKPSADTNNPNARFTTPVRLRPTFAESDEATSVRSKKALEIWYERLNELHEFKMRTGSTDVPQKYEENPQLGIWVNKQRCMRNKMSAEKIDALDRIDFNWGKKKGMFAWNEKYRELLSYKRKFKDCQVPTKYPANPALGRWVSTQRAQFKAYQAGSHSTMTRQKIKKLDEVGFLWSVIP